MMMLPSGQEVLCLKASIICAAINIVLNLLLIPRWGLNAAAATTAVAELVGIIIKVPFIDKEIRIAGFREMIKAPLIGSLGIVAMGVGMKFLFDSAIMVLCITVGISVPLYGAVLYFMKNEFVNDFVEPMINKYKG